MKRRAGDKHHLYELQNIESLLFHAFDLEGFYDKLMKVIERRIGKKDTVTIDDLREVDE